jgi:hypothetical protein
VEGVYIDMRQSKDSEYVAPGELISQKDRNVLDFLFLQ